MPGDTVAQRLIAVKKKNTSDKKISHSAYSRSRESAVKPSERRFNRPLADENDQRSGQSIGAIESPGVLARASADNLISGEEGSQCPLNCFSASASHSSWAWAASVTEMIPADSLLAFNIHVVTAKWKNTCKCRHVPNCLKSCLWQRMKRIDHSTAGHMDFKLYQHQLSEKNVIKRNTSWILFDAM